MFLKQANSDKENCIKKFKNSFTAETGNWKRHLLKVTRIARPWEWIALLKKTIFIHSSFQNVPFLL